MTYKFIVAHIASTHATRINNTSPVSISSRKSKIVEGTLGVSVVMVIVLVAVGFVIRKKKRETRKDALKDEEGIVNHFND